MAGPSRYFPSSWWSLQVAAAGEDNAKPAQQQGAEKLPTQLQELKDAGIDIELSRNAVRAAGAAIKEIETQAEGIAGVPESVTTMDLLPSEKGAEFKAAGH